MTWWSVVMHFIGVEPRNPSTAYNFWSGFGSDLGEVALIGAIISAARKVNCHSKGCWRMGRHDVEGTTYKVCSHHHRKLHGIEKGGVTFERIRDKHREAKAHMEQP